MPQLQAAWNRFNARERLIAMGAGLVLIAWVIGLLDRGFGVGSLSLLLAVAALVVLYLKYTNSSINWPVAVPLILLGISGVVALLAVLDLIDWLGYLNLIGIVQLVGLAAFVIGAMLMAWGSWQEYQIEKPALPNFAAANATTATPAGTPPAPGSTVAPAAPSATEPPAAAPPPAATDDTLPR